MGKVKFGDESKGINDSKENNSEEEEYHIKEQTKLQCKSCNCFFPETSSSRWNFLGNYFSLTKKGRVGWSLHTI